MYCQKCGALINEQGNFCPACGCSLTEQSRSREVNTANTEKKTNSLAIAGFAVSLVSLFLNLFGVTGLVAIGLSIGGLIQISKNKDSQTGKPFAIIGICVGAFSLLFSLFLIFILFLYL